MWKFIWGEINDSPRNSFVIDSTNNDGGYFYKPNNTESIYKILFGKQHPAFCTTLNYPNGTKGEPQSIECGNVTNGGCFFDVIKDYTEHNN